MTTVGLNLGTPRLNSQYTTLTIWPSMNASPSGTAQTSFIGFIGGGLSGDSAVYLFHSARVKSQKYTGL